MFSRLEYDESNQKHLVKDLLNLFRGRMRSAKSRPPRLHDLAYLLTLSFVILRAKLKHPAYHSEHEYRLLDALPKDTKRHNSKVEHFQRGTVSVPFFRIDLRASNAHGAGQPIRDVWIGPCVDFAAAETQLKNTVAYKTKPFAIKKSQVPMQCDEAPSWDPAMR